MRTKSEAAPAEKEDKFTSFVFAVFLAVVLGAGAVIWSLVKDNQALDKRVTVLETKCLPASVARGAHATS